MIKFVGAKLYPKQREIADQITSSEKMYHIIDAGRQTGKSFLCKQLLLWFAINHPGWRCMYISMTLSQTGKLFKELLRAISKSGVVAEVSKIDNCITLINGSELLFRSYQNADAIRGWDNDLLIVDEAAFCADEDFQAVFRPTLAVRGKKCILCSSPRGYNYFHDLYNYGLAGEKRYASYYATYKSCPYSNLDEIADAKLKLPDKIFRAEYLGEFIDGGMSVFDNFRECINLKVASGKMVAGIDVGRKNDYTVLTIMNGRQVVFQQRWRHDSWENIIRKICEELRKHHVRIVACESNGIGDVFMEDLRKVLPEGIILKDWVNTNTNKANIIERLIGDFNTHSISIPDEQTLLDELGNFEANWSKASRCITYAARGASNHDDTVISLAICNDLAHKAIHSGQYYLA